MISASALASAVPEMQDRGAFMSINAALQQFSGGLASSVAGLIVVQTSDGRLQHYDVLGWVVVSAMILTIVLMYPINRMVMAKAAQMASKAAAAAAAAATPAPIEAPAAE
jgi:hypothetical protein